MVDAVRGAGGELFAVTSEPQTLATEAETWEFGFPAVGDPHHEIRQICKERGLVDVFFNENYGHLRERSWASHPKGYYQPAVLALTREGRVLYRWRCRPTRQNMSGAGERPTATYVWNEIRSRLATTDEAPLDLDPEFAREDLSWPRFLLLLLAHGWFLRPKAFPLRREGDPLSASPRFMMRRVALFAGAWIAALALLPSAWVAIAFGVWALIAAVGVGELYRQFQHESGDDGEPV